MKNFAIVSVLALSSFLPLNLYAFHAVTEILLSNKIIVCKDSDQVRKGNKVEVYKLKMRTRDMSRSIEKTSEFTIPSEGQKIELFHKEFHFKGKLIPKMHNEKRGTATVVAPKVAGEERHAIKVSDGKSGKVTEQLEKITLEEEAEIAKKCFVAVPDTQINLKDVGSIAF
jgi:hypothetical protein